MKADYLSFRRAANFSLLGLALQLAMGVGLLIFALRTADHAAITGSVFVLIGVVVWLILAVVFDQHRREQIEAMEAEALSAADATSSSVFDEGVADLRIAARRLKILYKFVVPAASLLVGVALAGVGFWRFWFGRELVSPDEFTPSAYPIVAMVVGLSLGFIGFVLGRFISGMAKHKVWANLQAGGAYAVGTALLGAAMAAGHFIEFMGSDVLLRYLQLIVPIAMMVLGGEVFLNFILDIYRPRKPGEVARPAFDSRVLGFIAAPDRVARSISEAINYQFGSDVASTWLFQLIRRWGVMLALVGVGIFWLLSSIVVVQPHQRAIILANGAIQRADVGPGAHLKWPWPVGRVVIPEYMEKDRQGRWRVQGRTATGVRVFQASAPAPTEDKPVILWTDDHHGANERDYLLIVQPSAAEPDPQRLQPDPDGVLGRADIAAILAEVPIHYTIADVEAWERLAAPGHREELLQAVARREIQLFFSSMSVDEVLESRRASLAADLRGRIERAYAQLNPIAPGEPVVAVSFVGVEGVHPPKDVARAYENVINARQQYHRKLDVRRAEAASELARVAGSQSRARRLVAEIDRLERMIEAGDEGAAEQRLHVEHLLSTSGGDATMQIVRASAERWSRHLRARGRAAQYKGQVEAYLAAPAVYKATLWFDALRDITKDVRLYVVSDQVKDFDLWINLEDPDTAQSQILDALTSPDDQ